MSGFLESPRSPRDLFSARIGSKSVHRNALRPWQFCDPIASFAIDDRSRCARPGIADRRFDAIARARASIRRRGRVRSGVPPCSCGRSDEPYRVAPELEPFDLDIRMESWLPTDTIRRAGFGHVMVEPATRPHAGTGHQFRRLDPAATPSTPPGSSPLSHGMLSGYSGRQ